MYYLTLPIKTDIKNLSENEILDGLKLQKTKFYTFNNFYMQGIQAGIQAKHSSDELISKYVFNKEKTYSQNTLQLLETVYSKDKILILLNGGAQSDLIELVDFFDGLKDNIYPYAYFREEDGALNNAMTSVSAVLPELVFDNEVLKSAIFNFSRITKVKDFSFKEFIELKTNLYNSQVIFKFNEFFSKETFYNISNILNIEDIDSENFDNLFFFVRKNEKLETQDIFFFNENDFLITKKLMNYRLMT